MERIAAINYTARLEPPYTWEIFAQGEDGTQLSLKTGEGSWVDAMFKTQEMNKALGLKPDNKGEQNGKKD